ncbi:MAG: SCP2 sterol-binding domain-containing protein [gamma proteobacterium symbiont of Bathyaustriella thionipta]|nr:SCP2 sterol-binding domain-containing protein [gamma proteobacterium symbiont of Bathyaustriella thionipta]MCU7949786.1 SCP2 sterol-binding domain-containing protein [gamma proteobacterium symbiont of Bathyaustriella thionipta]MCU7954245.1 SCP2 sterol-binding domain-containing protein [gamma proteobacterium symbiont of Bathyaustriella thionipta]MCU7956380.1 SCP2 sterol-binding domain-containing protein [gamma proteobacterium symbiont of Bathyaustriella thionipta]
MNQTEKLNDINPLMIPLLAAIETGLNQLFAMDPDTYVRLARFKGRIVAFHITDIEQTLYFFPDQQGMQIVSHYEGEADTVISGSLLAFARMAMADEKSKTSAVFKGDIAISGDIALGQHFQSLFKQLDIDWEEHLSHITGDVIAHSLGNVARGFFGWGKQTLDSLSMDVSEYVQYETRDVASGPEINHFNTQIDRIRSDVDRAEARLNRLLQACAVHPTTNKKSAE